MSQDNTQSAREIPFNHHPVEIRIAGHEPFRVMAILEPEQDADDGLCTQLLNIDFSDAPDWVDAIVGTGGWDDLATSMNDHINENSNGTGGLCDGDVSERTDANDPSLNHPALSWKIVDEYRYCIDVFCYPRAFAFCRTEVGRHGVASPDDVAVVSYASRR